jgi:poly(A) polymerase
MKFNEIQTDPFILGAINAWGDIFSKTVRDDDSQHPQEWRAYKTWRFIPDMGLLMWWETPDDGEKLTVEDWLERKGYEIKLRSVMGQKLRVREDIKTLKGTPIKRYKNNVGKLVGPQIYVHRKYAAEVIPNDKLKFAAEVLKNIKANFRFNSIMFNFETGEVRFDEAKDFDTAREPHVGHYVAVSPNGTTREGDSKSIWHHKWLWVKDDYTGFDVDKARQWSTIWLGKLSAIAKGTDASFGQQLKDVGLMETSDPEVFKIGLDPNETQPDMPVNWDEVDVQILDKWSVETVRAFVPLPKTYQGIYPAIIETSDLDPRFAEEELEFGDDGYEWSEFRRKTRGFPPIVVRRRIGNRIEILDGNHRAKWAQESGYRTIAAWVIDDVVQADIEKDRKRNAPMMEGTLYLKELLMNEGSQDEAALGFLKKMVQSGPFRGKVFLAGGAVRDMEMGNIPKDLDVVVVSGDQEGGMNFAIWLAQQMGNYKEKSNPVLFRTYGTAKVVLRGQHNGVDLEGMDVEAVAARREEYTKGSRNPKVEPGTLADDVFRRDFTVNSLMLDLSTGEIHDITGKGRNDIKQGIIRTTDDPDKIFGQDALRMFRAIRFATQYNWQLAPEVVQGIKNNLENLGNTSRERIRDELDKILKTGNPRRGFELLRDTGLLPYIAQELQQAVGMTQNVHHNEDVFNHTLSVLQGTQPELVTRLMALFHDIGKVATRSETPSGVHFYGHEDVGADVAERIMTNLKYPTELIQAVKLGIKNHMRLKQGGDDAVKLSDKALRKFKIELGDQLEKLLDVIHADNTAHAGPSAMPNQIEKVRQRLKTLDIQVKKPVLPINGEDLKALGLKPGKAFSTILSAVADAWYDNPNVTREEALAIAQRMMSQ